MYQYKKPMRDQVLDFIMPILIVVSFVSLIAGTLVSAYMIDQKKQEYKKMCETQCSPFAYRTYAGCECQNKEGHWVPQEE